MKAKRLTVRPINQRTNKLPDETAGRDLVLLKAKDGRVTERSLFHNYPESFRAHIVGYTHYVVLPAYINR